MTGASISEEKPYTRTDQPIPTSWTKVPKVQNKVACDFQLRAPWQVCGGRYWGIRLFMGMISSNEVVLGSSMRDAGIELSFQAQSSCQYVGNGICASYQWDEWNGKDKWEDKDGVWGRKFSWQGVLNDIDYLAKNLGFYSLGKEQEWLERKVPVTRLQGRPVTPTKGGVNAQR